MNRNSTVAENRPVNLPVCTSKLRVGALLYLVLGSCGELEVATPVTWDYGFQCERDADRTEAVELQVAKGGCPITEPVVFEAVTAMWSTPGSRPQGLPAGLYAFQGTARDANGKAIASRCESVQIPMKGQITLNLQGASSCDGYDADLDDGGRRDGGTRNNGQDSGTIPDAGGPKDAGSMPDAAPIDECPDDPAKTTEGQCGCGNPDVDTDGDKTADCKESCDTDPNKVAPGTVCGCNPKTKLLPDQTLVVGGYLCGPTDDSVIFALEADGRLHLRVKGVQTWVSNKEPGALVRMQGDGNLVLHPMDPSLPVAWASGPLYPKGFEALLTVHANGTVTISGPEKVIWTVGTPQ